jgi:hypothetical protein
VPNQKAAGSISVKTHKAGDGPWQAHKGTLKTGH